MQCPRAVMEIVMTPMRVLLSRLVALIARRRREAELTDEIQAHLDALTEDHVRRGLSLANARAAARRDFGGIDQVKEAYRDQRTIPLVEVIGRDLRHALRSLRRSPLFTAVAVLTFALGVGATAAVFAIINSVLLRPLPYPNAARLVQIAQTLPSTRGSSAPPVIVTNLSPEQFRALRTQSRTLSHVVAYSTTSMTLTGIENPTRVNVGLVAAGFFEAFGVPVLLGRPFAVADEPSVGPGPVAMLSHGAWMRWFGGDSAAVGKVVTLNDRRYPIVGIMPDGFNVPQMGAATITRNDAGQLEDTLDFWLPWTAPASTGGGGSLFPALASMAEGITVDQAAAEVRALLPPLADGRRPTRVDVGSMRDQMVRAVRPTLMVFQIAVVFVLLIACANVANLLLARASHRRRELAIRLALGASRIQVARESLAECVLLALAGSLFGSIIAAVAVRVVRVFPPGIVPRMAEIRIDAATLGFALVLSMTAATVVAAFVSVRVLRAEAWRGVRDAAIDFSRSRPSPMLVVLQVAAALVLLVGAGLLLRSFVGLANRKSGFEANNVLTFRMTLPKARYLDARQQAAFYARLIQSMATIPDVEAAAAGTELPFQPIRLAFYPILIAGRPGEGSAISTSLVTPGYLRVFRVPIVRGREFDASDRPDAPLSAIVGQSFASRYFGSDDPLGRTVQVANAPPARVVGVAADTVRNPGIVQSVAYPGVYFSATQLPSQRPEWEVTSLTVALRTAHDPMAVVPAVRRALFDLDPVLPVYAVATVRQLMSERLAESRLYSNGAVAFAATALLLAVIGLYGVMAYSVGSRTQEWGIRMALGADAPEIIRHVVRSGFKLTAVGVVAGTAGAWLASRSLRTLLFGVTPNDPATLLGVAMLFFVVAGIACYVPARRASRVDPMVALRHE
jgi:putative ABC transport system permease protein